MDLIAGRRQQQQQQLPKQPLAQQAAPVLMSLGLLVGLMELIRGIAHNAHFLKMMHPQTLTHLQPRKLSLIIPAK